ncbi:hypothetical protein AWB79_05240 [Caballeronia hypogeia]|uniref:BioF2-like acetyltransferase domain-containing protein n=1 Tax=Caballeronia hypogeia TaxID=1777140 RepID=A0A158CEM3_9BURK|nr:GNAT family N-acetyltransferase [Caballeronia hypogeia]SAK80730.1 hypothetical protein AWB79_05240 [Caballeronia hypogeia]
MGLSVKADLPIKAVASRVQEQSSGLCIIDDPDKMFALRGEWEALWSSAGGLHNQAFAVAWLCWTRVAKPRGRKLHCIVYRENGELVLVWPLVSHRRLAWTVLEPLTPGTAEYTSILARADARTAIDAAWRAATRQCRADMLALPYVCKETRLDTLALRHAGLVETTVDVCATALLRQEPDWDAFCNSLGKLSKKKPGALERRFAKEGALEIRVLDSKNRVAHARYVEWMLERKREWAERVEKHGPWLDSREYRDFLINLLDGTQGDPLAVMFVMSLDGAPVVVSMVGIGSTCASGLIAGFDANFSRFSPGAIMMEHCVKWAWDNGMDLDFGVGKEEFKAYWSRGNVASIKSYQIAVSNWGKFAFYAKVLAKKLKTLRASKPRADVVDPAGSPAA